MTKSRRAQVEGLEIKIAFLKGIIAKRDEEISCLEIERDSAEEKIHEIKRAVDNTFTHTRVLR